MSRTTLLMRAKRRAWLRQGLTTEGKPRKNVRHPSLRGLGGNSREYHCRYMKWQRKRDRMAWAKE